MRKQTAILLFLLGLSLALFLSERPLTRSGQVQDEKTEKTAAAKPGQKECDLPPAQAPLFTQKKAAPVDPELRLETPPGLTKRVLLPTTRILSRRFEETEYSSTDFPSVFKGEQRGMDLHSEWLTSRLFPERTLPGLRLHIMKNRETGEYEPVGGSIGIPGTGLEAGYEAIPSTEEQKATLQFRKSF